MRYLPESDNVSLPRLVSVESALLGELQEGFCPLRPKERSVSGAAVVDLEVMPPPSPIALSRLREGIPMQFTSSRQLFKHTSRFVVVVGGRRKMVLEFWRSRFWLRFEVLGRKKCVPDLIWWVEINFALIVPH